jgi:hypothetical protein
MMKTILRRNKRSINFDKIFIEKESSTKIWSKFHIYERKTKKEHKQGALEKKNLVKYYNYIRQSEENYYYVNSAPKEIIAKIEHENKAFYYSSGTPKQK